MNGSDVFQLFGFDTNFCFPLSLKKIHWLRISNSHIFLMYMYYIYYKLVINNRYTKKRENHIGILLFVMSRIRFQDWCCMRVRGACRIYSFFHLEGMLASLWFRKFMERNVYKCIQSVSVSGFGLAKVSGGVHNAHDKRKGMLRSSLSFLSLV